MGIPAAYHEHSSFIIRSPCYLSNVMLNVMKCFDLQQVMCTGQSAIAY